MSSLVQKSNIGSRIDFSTVDHLEVLETGDYTTVVVRPKGVEIYVIVKSKHIKLKENDLIAQIASMSMNEEVFPDYTLADPYYFFTTLYKKGQRYFPKEVKSPIDMIFYYDLNDATYANNYPALLKTNKLPFNVNVQKADYKTPGFVDSYYTPKSNKPFVTIKFEGNMFL